MLVSIVLNGALKKHYEKEIKIHANTLREALSALKLIPEFDPAKTSKRFLCQVPGCTQEYTLDEPLEKDTIYLDCQSELSTRDIVGSGNNPYVRIIIGVILITVGLFFDPSGQTSSYGMALVSAGVTMIIGGVMQLINPLKEDSASNDNKSQSATSYPNTVKSGTPIPIILGKHKFGGHIFSLNTVSTKAKELSLGALISSNGEFDDSWETLSSSDLPESSGHQRGRNNGGTIEP